MSDCRVLKRASASLSLRLPRGRPPAVGIDSSFFNLTPPSAEAVTPTKEKDIPILSENVETSITIPAPTPKEPVTEKSDAPENQESKTDNDTYVMASRPDSSFEPHSWVARHTHTRAPSN